MSSSPTPPGGISIWPDTWPGMSDERMASVALALPVAGWRWATSDVPVIRVRPTRSQIVAPMGTVEPGAASFDTGRSSQTSIRPWSWLGPG